eukprot:TRINITY_DN2561_c0_g1_i1.p1 TRINITY_DN2561_c0_g1~~TRINITY_DN2561_c0_g1_i1.p1  ORF type:complete len:179 (+),score=44.56 TRINITY_DN2561_c0_g1_i1:123-659(+)
MFAAFSYEKEVLLLPNVGYKSMGVKRGKDVSYDNVKVQIDLEVMYVCNVGVGDSDHVVNSGHVGDVAVDSGSGSGGGSINTGIEIGGTVNTGGTVGVNLVEGSVNSASTVNYTGIVNWTVNDVVCWMKTLPLSKDYSPAIISNEIDGKALLILTENDWKEIVPILGDRRKCINALPTK